MPFSVPQWIKSIYTPGTNPYGNWPFQSAKPPQFQPAPRIFGYAPSSPSPAQAPMSAPANPSPFNQLLTGTPTYGEILGGNLAPAKATAPKYPNGVPMAGPIKPGDPLWELSINDIKQAFPGMAIPQTWDEIKALANKATEINKQKAPRWEAPVYY